MMQVAVSGLGLCGPGLPGWQASRAGLAGLALYIAADTIIPAPALLPPTERRRAVGTVRLALAVGSEALADVDPAGIATVFTSSGGDGETVHSILEVLASDERAVSPTRFHNSVHNAPAGYWSIATGSRAPTTSLCAYDASFAMGLLEAAAQVVTQRRPVALIAYDLPYPAPLAAVRKLGPAFGVTLLLSPEAVNPLALLQLDLKAGTAADTVMADPTLEALRTSVPAARSLPVLAGIAKRQAQDIVLAGLSGNYLHLSLAFA
jgi:hypothetical protein